MMYKHILHLCFKKDLKIISIGLGISENPLKVG